MEGQIKMRALFQITDKEIEDMTLDELRVERMVHRWAARKQMTNIYTLNRNVHWLEENPLPFDIEDVKGQFKRGEIPQRLYASRCATYSHRKREEKAADMRLLYAKEMKRHEESVMAILDERIEEVKHEKDKRKTGPKPRNPRQRSGRNNQKVDWKEKHPVIRRQKPLAPHSKYWASIQEKNRTAKTSMQKAVPIVTWSYEKLKRAARAAGFYTDEMIRVAVARELETTTNMSAKLLRTGRLSWGQAMLIGGLFEMTPAVFCDVFLNGYFKEIADGRFVAQVDDKDALREN